MADVFELSAAPTNRTITIYITKDPLLNLTFNNAVTIVGGRLVQNSVLSFDGISDSSFYLLTMNQSTGAGSELSVDLSGQLVPGNTKRHLIISALIVGSRGEYEQQWGFRNNRLSQQISSLPFSKNTFLRLSKYNKFAGNRN